MNKENEIPVSILSKNEKYRDCTIEKKVNDLEILKEFKFSIECNVQVCNYKTNYEKNITRKIYCCGNTYEECLECFFIQARTWTYCNDTNIIFVNDTDKEAYNKYFYKDSDGISRYASCGGDMN